MSHGNARMPVVRQDTVSKEPKLCSATIQGEPCDKLSEKRGLCGAHYYRMRNGNDMDAPWFARPSRSCGATILGEPCDKPHYGNGLCSGHRERLKNGSPDMDAPWKGTKLCPATVEGEPCGRKTRQRGFCNGHALRFRRGTEMDAPWTVKDPDRSCSGTIGGEPCDRPYSKNGYCKGHAERQTSGTDMDAPWQIHINDRTCIAVVNTKPCGRPAHAHDLCPGHLARRNAGLDVNVALMVKDSSRTCSIDGCDKPYWSNDRCKRHWGIYRHHKKKAAEVEPSGFSAARENERMSMFGDVCWLCGDPIHQDRHIDHVKPLAAGGAHTPANLRPTHGTCNMSKGANWPVDTSTAHLRLDPSRLP